MAFEDPCSLCSFRNSLCEPLLAVLRCFYGPCSPCVLDPSGSYNPSFFSSVVSQGSRYVWLCDSVPSAAGRSLSADNWAKQCHYEYSRISSGIILLFFLSVMYCFTFGLRVIQLIDSGHLGSVGMNSHLWCGSKDRPVIGWTFS